MGLLTTGNEIVDAVSKINFQGDITPRIWRKTITKANGKPYALARDILSDIVYWYRATEVVDPDTMEITMKKKFRDDLLYKSYEQLCEEFGESKRVIREVLKRLEELGVIKRQFRTVTHENGYTMNNVMYIELIPDMLLQLTYPDPECEEIESSQEKQQSGQETTKNGTLLPPSDENVTRGETEQQGENEDTPSDENVTRVVTDLSSYTENTSKNTSEYNSQYQSIKKEDNNTSTQEKDDNNIKGQGKNRPVDRMDGKSNRAEQFVENTVKLKAEQGEVAFWKKKQELKEQFLADLPAENGETYSITFVREWFDYQDLLTMCGQDSSPPQWKEEINGIMNILYDILNTSKATIRVSGDDKPSAVVIGRLLKLNSFDIIYTLKQYHAQTTRIRNQRSYLLTILYLAKEQQKLDISNQVMHDMARKEG